MPLPIPEKFIERVHVLDHCNPLGLTLNDCNNNLSNDDGVVDSYKYDSVYSPTDKNVNNDDYEKYYNGTNNAYYLTTLAYDKGISGLDNKHYDIINNHNCNTKEIDETDEVNQGK